MKIAVLLKYYKGELGPFDSAALECALEYGKDITIVAMAPRSIYPALQSLTRLGVKAVLISDPAFAGSDTIATSYILSEALKRISPDIIFAGRQSIDGDTSQVPPMIAERLGFDIVRGVMSLEGNEVVTREGEVFPLKNGTIFTFERIRTLRFPSIFSRQGEVEIWDNSLLSLPLKKCGLTGSPTRVIRSYESSLGRRSCQFAELSSLDALISESMQKRCENTAPDITEKIDKIYYFGDIKDIAECYSEKTIKLNDEGMTPYEVAKTLEELQAAVVFFESTEYYKTLAARIAVITESGLCADCISFRREGEQFIMTRPALGGNITADIVCTSRMSLATVRKTNNTGNELIFAIGRGASQYIDKIEALAKEYGAQVAASRPLVDDGTLPYEMQVGITGRRVCPRVYVTFGISGAVQHTSAISGALTIISINSDKSARIFDYSDYGIVADIKNLFKEL